MLTKLALTTFSSVFTDMGDMTLEEQILVVCFAFAGLCLLLSVLLALFLVVWGVLMAPVALVRSLKRRLERSDDAQALTLSDIAAEAVREHAR